MKFELNTMLMQAVLNKSVKGVSTKDLMPSLKNFLITATAKNVNITAGDGATYVIKDIPCASVAQEGVVCVDAKELTKLINKITSDTVVFEIADSKLRVKSGKSKFNLKMTDPQDYIYPEQLKFDVENKKVSLPALKQALKLCSITVSNNVTEIYFTGYKIGKKVITTNRNNLTCIDLEVSDTDLLLTHDIVSLLYELDGEDALVSYSENFIQFVTDGTLVVGNLLSGLEFFPPNEALESFEYTNVTKINRKDMLPVLERALIFVETLGAVELLFKESTVECRLVGNSDADTYEEVPHSGKIAITDPIRVNAGMLSNILSALQTDEVELLLGDSPEDPLLIRSGTYSALTASMSVE